MARSFCDLDVYRMAHAEAQRVVERSRLLPPHERFALGDQLTRSSRAVAALIAEAWPRRRYPRAFANLLNQALAEANETQAWLDHAHASGYLSEEEFNEFDRNWEAIGGKLENMIRQAARFRPHAK